MSLIEFTKTVRCDGRTFEAGAIVDRDAVPHDLLATCLRVGHAREVEGYAPVSRGTLVTLPAGMDVRPVGPTDDDMRAAVAEIERLRQALETRAQQLTAMVAERDAAVARVAELEALKPVVPVPETPVSVTVEPEHPPAPEPKPEEKPSGGAKPPVVGPSKPPELKGSRK